MPEATNTVQHAHTNDDDQSYHRLFLFARRVLAFSLVSTPSGRHAHVRRKLDGIVGRTEGMCREVIDLVDLIKGTGAWYATCVREEGNRNKRKKDI